MIRQLVVVSTIALAACATTSSVQPVTPLAATQTITLETLMAMNAMCGAEARFSGDLKADIKLVEGMGSGGFAVDSDNPDAQEIPEQLALELSRTIASINLYEQTLTRSRDDQTELATAFERDIQRFRQLKGG